jgi:Ca2+/Na+ antiporter
MTAKLVVRVQIVLCCRGHSIAAMRDCIGSMLSGLLIPRGFSRQL